MTTPGPPTRRTATPTRAILRPAGWAVLLACLIALTLAHTTEPGTHQQDPAAGRTASPPSYASPPGRSGCTVAGPAPSCHSEWARSLSTRTKAH
ncbi:hypothetical protein ACWEKT_19980 [Nocardia takedensis]|uniref:hypothetical protein n=1 Tax=Nocardia takedensis TaxID=259390 RepID=UPI0002E49877|nr:hypothetical protein [Nocardia takedensis]